MRAAWVWAVAAAWLVAAAGCEDGGGGVCVPNQSVLCSCAGGLSSVRSCNAEGSGFGPCACAALGGEPDADAEAPSDTTEAADTSAPGDAVATDGGGDVEPHADADADADTTSTPDGCTPTGTAPCCTACEAPALCLEGACQEPSFDGTWQVTADPPSQLVGVLGTVSFPATTMEMTTTGTAVTLVDVGATPPVTYTGTRDGPALALSATYTRTRDAQTLTYEATVAATLAASLPAPGQPPLLELSGTLSQTISKEVAGLGRVPVATAVWSLSGVRTEDEARP